MCCKHLKERTVVCFEEQNIGFKFSFTVDLYFISEGLI